ncbi:scarecrow-like protein 3 [Oryza brachyantha]|uniref:Uncharacterized protein n=1 Tax=Oryza brachyantha TaxID=4533 RepID=J3M6M0_ORYBR|nr:scarecrow-like protein 3 [Oryza brachyantha]
MEKMGVSSTSVNASAPMLGQAADVPTANFQLFGSMLPVPAASMATATAPAPTADNGASGSVAAGAAAQNASGSVQGQGDGMSLSLQLWPVGSTTAAVSSPPVAPVTGPGPAAVMPAPLAMAAAENASLAAVANALALRRKNVATQRSTALLGHLRRCAEALAVSRSEDADAELASIALLASPDGDAVQRMAAAFAEALARVALRPWKGIAAMAFPSDGSDRPRAWEAAAARMNFLNLCPVLHLAAVAVNEIILETTRNDRFIQVVDLGGVHYGQWVDLLHALATRRESRPCLRLTVVHEDKQFLYQASLVIMSESDRVGVPLDLHIVESSSLLALKLDSLGVRSDHAVVIVSTLKLHPLIGTGNDTAAAASAAAGGMASSLPSPSTTLTNVDKLLRGFHLLSPKLMIVTENEASHFGPSFMERFASALGYYEQLFTSVEEGSAAYGGEPAQRKEAERFLLREEIKDIIACEDGPRWARHERLVRWIARIAAAGFVFSPTSSGAAVERVRSVAARMPGGEKVYGVAEAGSGWLVLRREEKPMFSVSAWRRR